ncbi:hypothetical protein [Paenibacillus sp. DMB5]|uniref:hypothetical protein n=1 Tax=Paenibacillus sp. DMB5 TaxID=1780103 RepID=UPI00076BC756|nr:hypothetical protein [Paenibacillus sp. DMB5]KUP25432.1 hypothetical protein AWJ19_06485 [Paenibacillus sp. DMB5]
MLNDTLKQYYENSPWKDAVFSWYPFENGVAYERVMDPKDLSIETLAAYKDKLGAHGRLLLVYENPFALRYWAGERASNHALPYDTLFGRGERPLPSKAELQTRLRLAGFEGQKWFYPLTDHYFTREVYSENYLPDEFLNQRFIPYIRDDVSLQFDERFLYREVIRGGAFEFMCGAYFVEARVCQNDPPCIVDYAAVTAYREPAKRFATTVRGDGTVHKTPLHPDGKAGLLRTLRNHKELAGLGVNVITMKMEGNSLVMPRLNFPTLWDYWAEKLSDGTFDVNEMVSQFDRIREAIMRAAKSGKCFWELVPANCFYDKENDELIFIDQEYYWEDASPDIALTRALWALLYSPAFGMDSRRDAWLELLKARYGLSEQFDVLSKQADLQTRTEVFGDMTLPLELETERSMENISRRPPEIAYRYYRLLPAAKKLRELGFDRPAIYGFGLRGKTLFQVFNDSGIDVTAVIDKNLQNNGSLEGLLLGSSCDVLIVSNLEGEDIKKDLSGRVNVPIYTLGELINEQAK